MHELVIKIEGFPETVQHIADVIDDAFPGKFVWTQAEDYSGIVIIRIEGYVMPSMSNHVVRNLAA